MNKGLKNRYKEREGERVQAEFSLINKWLQSAAAGLQHVNNADEQLSLLSFSPRAGQNVDRMKIRRRPWICTLWGQPFLFPFPLLLLTPCATGKSLCFDPTRLPSLVWHAGGGGVTVEEPTLLIFHGEYLKSFDMQCLPFEKIAAHSSLQVQNSCCREGKAHYRRYESSKDLCSYSNFRSEAGVVCDLESL